MSWTVQFVAVMLSSIYGAVYFCYSDEINMDGRNCEVTSAVIAFFAMYFAVMYIWYAFFRKCGKCTTSNIGKN